MYTRLHVLDKAVYMLYSFIIQKPLGTRFIITCFIAEEFELQ